MVLVVCCSSRAADHAADLPVVLVFPSWGKQTHPSSLSVPSSAKDLLTHINIALLHPMVNQTVCAVFHNKAKFV